ncbi:hypothetical protein Q9L58_006273 [Maublancomyces gigas]|uniref:G-protein coupled receptors family 2 profile 2 domain-containing protein n=1 Tax=Discina gigas TaxID=1032678 RepID=A0ABR3GFX3_9PEZI
MALNFMLSTSMNISGYPIGDESRKDFCSVNGFLTQAFVVQTDYWVLIIATNTFLILGDQKRAAAWVQDHWIILWLLPWGFSLLWASLGLAITGYGDIGAWCWFTSDLTRLLVNFIQRWVIIVSILAIYIRLYFIIYKAHRGTVSDEEVSVVLNVMPIGSDPKSKRDTHTVSKIKIRGDAKALKRVSYRMMQYPLAYMFIWIIPTSIRIYHATGGGQAPLYLNILDKGCIVIQGFIDAMVYGFNERAWNGWKDFLFGDTRRFPI